MPTKYMERLILPLNPNPVEDVVVFTTRNGLPLAKGYNAVVLTDRGPMVEFHEDQILQHNINVPDALMWRRKHPEALYAEFRSRDYCSVKVFEQRRDVGNMRKGMWYISPFDLASDKYPVLIERLRKQRREGIHEN